jgi:16S rRNA (cytosine1402-N4)-methyltransferase
LSDRQHFLRFTVLNQIPPKTTATDSSHEDAFHVPVLAGKVAELLVTDPDGTYVDCTIGGGGHTRILLERLSEKGRLIGIDRDADAIARSRVTLPATVSLIRCRFSEIGWHLNSERGTVAGLLADLGVSSFQIDTGERGFSHRFPGPLDLRMDPTVGETAAQLISRLDRRDLARLIGDYGEDSQASRIAAAIVRERERQPIVSTEDLTRIISKAVPATRVKSLARVFQALRIAVNDELNELQKGLEAGWELLRPGGRFAVISYHSLEDRIVKTFMKDKSTVVRGPLGLPGEPEQPATGKPILRKPLIPEDEEIAQNPRSRSAKLRVIEKLV